MSSGRTSPDRGDASSWPLNVAEAVMKNPIELLTTPNDNPTITTSTDETTCRPKIAIPRLTPPVRPVSPERFKIRWTTTEVEKMMTLRSQGLKFAEIAAQMSGRTELACSIAYRKFTKDMTSLEGSAEETEDLKDDDELDENSSALNNNEVEAIPESLDNDLGRVNSTSIGHVPEIDHKAEGEILPIPPVPQPWTDMEDRILLGMISKGFSFAELYARLPDRSLGDCYRRYQFYLDQWENKN